MVHCQASRPDRHAHSPAARLLPPSTPACAQGLLLGSPITAALFLFFYSPRKVAWPSVVFPFPHVKAGCRAYMVFLCAKAHTSSSHTQAPNTYTSTLSSPCTLERLSCIMFAPAQHVFTKSPSRYVPAADTSWTIGPSRP